MLKFKSRLLLAAAGSLLTLSACNAGDTGGDKAAAAGNDKPAVTVNGTPISQARIDIIVNAQIARGQQDTPELRKAIKDELIKQTLLSQEAIKKGLDKKPDVVTQIELSRQSVLVNAYFQNYLAANPVSEEALKAEYEKIKAQMGDKEYKARHILVKTETEANNIIATLKKDPKKFGKLAAEKSLDPGSKGNGGDLGWFGLSSMVKPFADAVAKLEKGKYTMTPVQSQFGWHVILLDDSRPLQTPPFEQVKGNLTQRLQQQQIEKAVAELRGKAKIEEAAAPAAPAKK